MPKSNYMPALIMLWVGGFLAGSLWGGITWLYNGVLIVGAGAGVAYCIGIIREIQSQEREFKEFSREMRKQYPEYEWPGTEREP